MEPEQTLQARDSDERYFLRCGPAATAAVKSSLHLAVRPHLHDVRAMLRLPLPALGITAGCNFASVHVLLNVISGLSRLLGPSETNSRKAFTTFVRRWYPWREEPRGARYRQTRGTATLYEGFRTGFAHDLGLLLEGTATPKPNIQRFRFRVHGDNLGVSKEPTLSPARLRELDEVTRRPPWLGPTIDPGPSGPLIDAVALYWGVRRAVFDYTSSPRATRSFDRMIQDTWDRRKAAGRITTYSG